MKSLLPLTGLALLLADLPLATLAQTTGGVRIGTAGAPDASAVLDLRPDAAIAPKGLLPPRLTQAQRDAIASPAAGLVVYQTDNAPGLYVYNGSSWVLQGDNLGNHTATQALNLAGNALVGTGADLGSTMGVGVRADGGLNLGQNTVGNNVLLGYQAGRVATGSYNLFNGYQSGYSNTTGFRNLFSGHQSGYFNTTGSNNTAVGASSGPANGSGDISNATALGANVSLTQSNTVVLGNNASVGIGTPSPSQKLEVAGQVFSSSGGFRFPDNSVQPTAATGANFVQIGTTPQANASFNISGSATVGGNSLVGGSLVADANGANTGTVANALVFGRSSSGEGLGSNRSSGTNPFGLDFYTSSRNRLAITGAGNVGIGTTAPSQLLELGGQVAPALLLHSTTNNLVNGATLQWRESDLTYGWNLRHNTGSSEGGSTNDRLLLDRLNGGTPTTAMSWDQTTGNVGIGTSAPATALDVRGAATVSTSVTTPALLTPTTGAHNMVAIAYGSYQSILGSASLQASSGNVSVTRTSAGTYTISIPNVDVRNAIIVATAGPTTGYFIGVATGAGTVYTSQLGTGNTLVPTDASFSFVVYNP